MEEFEHVYSPQNKDEIKRQLMERLGMNQEQVDCLSDTTLALRWILAYGVVSADSGNFMGVISIDSRHEDLTEAKVDTADILRVASVLGSLIEVRA